MKYFDKKEDILDDKTLIKGLCKAQNELERKIKYYMLMAVQVSDYLWT